MDTSAIDFPALTLATIVALGITVALWFGNRGDDKRRRWIAAAVLAAVLLAIGLLDVLRATPRETHVATAVLGATLPVLGSMGVILGTRRVRPLVRWPMVFMTAFVLLFGGVLVGASVLPKYLPF